jgi:hypothetical protein
VVSTHIIEHIKKQEGDLRSSSCRSKKLSEDSLRIEDSSRIEIASMMIPFSTEKKRARCMELSRLEGWINIEVTDTAALW